MQTQCGAFHGGKFFEAIGVDFSALERSADVINADVLDAWFDPSPRVIEKLTRFLPFLARTSPPVRACGLTAAIARVRGVKQDHVLAGGGSSDLIFTCLPRLIEPRRKALILDPMYGEYRHVFETVMGLEVARFPLDEQHQFRIDTDRLISFARSERPDLVALVNPNSPTGQHWPRREVLALVDALPPSTWVVVDETYIEYAGSSESVEQETSRRQNLIVIKSMSKVFALSGLRVGYLIASGEVVRRLSRWLPPWAVSLPAQVAGVEALQDTAYYEGRYRETHALREAFASGLARIPNVRVYPSTANFVLVELPAGAERTAARMRWSNVFVRNCDSMSNRFDDRFLRIAVKGSAHAGMILTALRDAMFSGRPRKEPTAHQR
jgi:histidinol-phosphate aminotransferase